MFWFLPGDGRPAAPSRLECTGRIPAIDGTLGRTLVRVLVSPPPRWVVRKIRLAIVGRLADWARRVGAHPPLFSTRLFPPAIFGIDFLNEAGNCDPTW